MADITINNETLTYNNIIYIDSVDGDDTNGDGSENNPYKSLATGLNNAVDGDAIKLIGVGPYQLNNFTDIFANLSDFAIIGNRTKIEVQNGGQDTSQINNIKLYQLIFEPVSSMNYFYRANNSNNNFEYYNCVFQDPNSYFNKRSIDHFSGSFDNAKFVNCAFLDDTVLLYDSIELINCATDQSEFNAYSNQGTYTTCMTSISFDDNYNIIENGWENTGTGTNPDGTQAHIGVYGGTYAWTVAVISGVVTSGGVGKQGADVYLIDVDNMLVDSKTTDSNGEYIFEGLNIDSTYHIMVAYIENGTMLTSQSKPFINPVKKNF